MTTGDAGALGVGVVGVAGTDSDPIGAVASGVVAVSSSAAYNNGHGGFSMSEPSLRANVLSATITVDKADHDATAAFQTNAAFAASIASCAESVVRSQGGIRGEIDLSLDVRANGRISGVTLDKDDLKPAAAGFSGCVLARAAVMSWPQPPGKPAKAVLRLFVTGSMQ